MLSFVTTDTAGEKHLLPAPLSLMLQMEEDVPADDLYAVFPDCACGELCTVNLYEGDRLVFRGVVDVQEHMDCSTGKYLRITARSPAAHLLDNEAPPLGYDHPSARLIYDRHVRAYGITAGDLDDATYYGELAITKGMSQWSVVSAFCSACYSSKPRVSADGTLYLKGLPSAGRVLFGDEGIRYTALSDSIRRCEELSRVNVKISGGDGYDHPVENADAVKRGIRRERYLNAMLAIKSVKSADIMLQRSREKARSLQLSCPGRRLGVLGCDADVSGYDAGGDGWYVSAVKYRMNSKGDCTTVKLKRRLKQCG